MTYDKITFLSFPTVSAFPIVMVREEYERLVKELNVIEPDSFEEILDWFKDDKVIISREE